MNQKQAVNQIQSFLKQRGIELVPGYLQVVEQSCIVLEIDNRAIAVDPGSGIWTGEAGKWKCLDRTCTVSGALQAIEFLTEDQQ